MGRGRGLLALGAWRRFGLDTMPVEISLREVHIRGGIAGIRGLAKKFDPDIRIVAIKRTQRIIVELVRRDLFLVVALCQRLPRSRQKNRQKANEDQCGPRYDRQTVSMHYLSMRCTVRQ